jgi:hypothetical protein
MKLVTALSTAMIALMPADALAKDFSSDTSASSYPYPDWPAIAKTAKPSPQKGAEGSPSDVTKAGSNLLEKTGRALETVTGGSASMKKEPSQESTSSQSATEEQPSAATKSEPSLLEKTGRALETVTGGSASMKAPSQEGTGPQPATEEKRSTATKSEPGLLEKAGRALETVTGAPQKQPTAESQSARQQETNPGSYPYPDWPAIAKTASPKSE